MSYCMTVEQESFQIVPDMIYTKFFKLHILQAAFLLFLYCTHK